jgi:hypothetical protein
MELHRPIPDSYWVRLAVAEGSNSSQGRLLAGEYPGAKNQEEANQKLKQLLQAGVNLFIDLTEAGEHGLRPYAPLLAFIAGDKQVMVGYKRHPIPDMSTPSSDLMASILDGIDEALQSGMTVYLHCYGGIGRTGTVVGCWLVRHGLTGRQAIAKIGAWRRDTPDGWRKSPETDDQREFILAWGNGQ